MIDHLVMDEKRVKNLKALSKSFARINTHGETIAREPWTADFVRGKGNGLIILLHGSPGNGKTYTAGENMHRMQYLRTFADDVQNAWLPSQDARL